MYGRPFSRSEAARAFLISVSVFTRFSSSLPLGGEAAALSQVSQSILNAPFRCRAALVPEENDQAQRGDQSLPMAALRQRRPTRQARTSPGGRPTGGSGQRREN